MCSSKQLRNCCKCTWTIKQKVIKFLFSKFLLKLYKVNKLEYLTVFYIPQNIAMSSLKINLIKKIFTVYYLW